MNEQNPKSGRLTRRLVILLCGWSLLCSSALSHQMSTAYLTATLNDAGVIEGESQLRLYDLEQAIGLDSNGDSQLLWQEVLNRRAAIDEYITTNMTLRREGQNCSLTLLANWQVDTHFNEAYLVVPLRAQCPLAGELEIGYSAFFSQDAEHKLLLNFHTADGNHSRVLSDSQRALSLSGRAGSHWATFQEFLYQGIIHIWVGLDHILFLLSLLLTCVLIRIKGYWAGKDDIRQIVISATWIVTAFTLAHSITLSATALGWVNLSSRWVEVGIAATVVLVALNNVYPLVLRLGWLTFGFGLLHGMGFAGVLGELGVPADQKLLTVLAFNLGVEIGQLAIVFAVIPLLAAVRNYRWYTRYGLTSGSLLIAMIGLWWMAERI